MKKEVVIILLACVYSVFPCLAFSDEPILVLEEMPPPNVDIPDNLGTAGLTLEGFYLRGINNNLVYAIMPFNTNSVLQLSQNYAFGGHIAIDYVDPYSSHLSRLEYEHLPETHAGQNFFNGTTHYHASVESSYRAFNALVEQSLLIGPYWETTFIAGLSYVQLSQRFSPQGLFFVPVLPSSFISAAKYELQLSGGGLIGGLRALLNYYGFAVGTEVLPTLLIMKNRLNNSFDINQAIPPVIYTTVVNVSGIMSVVPELQMRGFLIYGYQFQNDTQLTAEIGYRFNQFFNVRTNHAFLDLESQEIGFAGPYLRFRYSGVI